jgi:hypothetical protein
MHPRFAVAVTVTLIAVAACVRTSPQPAQPEAPPPPVIHVPEGCTASLAGPWVHATDPGYRYDAEDDGGTLTLFVTHHFVPDAGFSPRKFRRDAGASEDAGLVDDAGVPDAGDLPTTPAVRVELQRTADGFVGHTLASLPHPSGRLCDARFPTRVLSCGDAGLVLETHGTTALGETCQPPARPLDVPRLEHVLIRPPAR